MRKLIITLCALLSFSVLSSNAASELISSDAVVKAQNKISNIGFHILNTNNIEKRMVFYYDT